MSNNLKIIKAKQHLIFNYYLIYALLLLLFAGAHFSTFSFTFGEQIKMILQVVSIMFLLSIPAAMKLFAFKITAVRADLVHYVKWMKIQMVLIALPALSASVTYSLLKDSSSLFVFLISLVMLIFCKPSEGKIVLYLEKEAS